MTSKDKCFEKMMNAIEPIIASGAVTADEKKEICAIEREYWAAEDNTMSNIIIDLIHKLSDADIHTIYSHLQKAYAIEDVLYAMEQRPEDYDFTNEQIEKAADEYIDIRANSEWFDDLLYVMDRVKRGEC